MYIPYKKKNLTFISTLKNLSSCTAIESEHFLNSTAKNTDVQTQKH